MFICIILISSPSLTTPTHLGSCERLLAVPQEIAIEKHCLIYLFLTHCIILALAMIRIFMCCNSAAGLLLCYYKHYKTWIIYTRSGLHLHCTPLFVILCSDSLRLERVKWLRKAILTKDHLEFYFSLSSPSQCFVVENLKSVVFSSSSKELINMFMRIDPGKKSVSMYQFDQDYWQTVFKNESNTHTLNCYANQSTLN